MINHILDYPREDGTIRVCYFKPNQSRLHTTIFDGNPVDVEEIYDEYVLYERLPNDSELEAKIAAKKEKLNNG